MLRVIYWLTGSMQEIYASFVSVNKLQDVFECVTDGGIVTVPIKSVNIIFPVPWEA